MEESVGDGPLSGVRIGYPPDHPALETAGGVARALPLLDDAPFLVVSGDIPPDFDYARLHPRAEAIAGEPARHVAHFVLVDNPAWHALGDMGLADGRGTPAGPPPPYGT